MKRVTYTCDVCKQDWNEVHLLGINHTQQSGCFIVNASMANSHVCTQCQDLIKGYEKQKEKQLPF